MKGPAFRGTYEALAEEQKMIEEYAEYAGQEIRLCPCCGAALGIKGEEWGAKNTVDDRLAELERRVTEIECLWPQGALSVVSMRGTHYEAHGRCEEEVHRVLQGLDRLEKRVNAMAGELESIRLALVRVCADEGVHGLIR